MFQMTQLKEIRVIIGNQGNCLQCLNFLFEISNQHVPWYDKVLGFFISNYGVVNLALRVDPSIVYNVGFC